MRLNQNIFDSSYEKHADWASVFHISILEFSPRILSYLYFPSRAHDTRKGAIFRDVQTLLLLHGTYGQ